MSTWQLQPCTYSTLLSGGTCHAASGSYMQTQQFSLLNVHYNGKPFLARTSLAAPRSRNWVKAQLGEEKKADTQIRSDTGTKVKDGEEAQALKIDTAVEKQLSKAIRSTAATFAPRSSTARKNPAVPGSTLFKIFEVQGYVMMAIGGLLSFNVLFPSQEPDIWRLMGMWSVWMFTVPSLRARDCSNKEKEALNYLFLVIPLINVLLPFVWRSFAAVYSVDVLAFVLIFAWKLEWLSLSSEEGSK